jgi:hypothetical protein
MKRRPCTDPVGGYIDLELGGPETTTKQCRPTVAYHELPYRENNGGCIWYISLQINVKDLVHT